MTDDRYDEAKKDFLFGIRPVIEAIKSGKEIDKIFVQNGLKGSLISELKAFLSEHSISYQYVPIEKLNRFTTKNHQGVVAFVSPVSFYSIENLLPSIYEQAKVPFIVVLDKVTDVRNFGAIVRTAECSGAHAIIIPSKGSAQINADAVKTSAGAIYKIPICKEHNLKLTLEYLKESGLQIVSCTEKAETNYFDVDLTSPTVILLGSEESGISPEYLKRCDKQIKIPLMGKIESLNVSVASGIIFYEVVKQRLQSKI